MKQFSRFTFEQSLKDNLINAYQTRQRPKIVTRTLKRQAVKTLQNRGYPEPLAVQIVWDVDDIARLELLSEVDQ